MSALRESRCLNPHPERVTDPAFLAEEFFDVRDAVQVKYEMVRRVQVEGASVTATAAAFGYSRPSYYEAAAALAAAGLDGLVAGKPGPRGGHKLTDEVLTRASARPVWSTRSSNVSVCACTPARSNAPWPGGESSPKSR